MKTRAAVLREMGAARPYAESRPLEIVELELEPPGPGEVLVEVGAAGLCHSDLSVIDGSRPRVMPMALGHEAAGEVTQVGDGVESLAVGDHVVLAFVPACGSCGPCRSGRAALCEPGAAANAAGTLLSGAIRLRDADGQPIHHHLGVSAFSERIVVSERSAVKVPSELPYEIAALFGCAVLTGVGAAIHSAGIKPGETVAVFGLGGRRAGGAARRRSSPAPSASSASIGFRTSSSSASASGPRRRWPPVPGPSRRCARQPTAAPRS